MVDAEWQARADKCFQSSDEKRICVAAADLDETIYRPERQLDTQTIERLVPAIDRGRKESHCNRIFRQWKTLSQSVALQKSQ